MISQEKFTILRVLGCVNLLCCSTLVTELIWKKTSVNRNLAWFPSSGPEQLLWDVTEIVLAFKDTWNDVSSVYGNPSFKRVYLLVEMLWVPSSLIEHGWTWRCWGCESIAAPTQVHRQEGSSSSDILLKNMMKMEQPQPDKSHPSLNRRNRRSVQLLWLKYAGFICGHQHCSSSRFLHLLLSLSLSFICSSSGRWSKPAN